MHLNAPIMKTIEKIFLDYFLELPLEASSFLEIDHEYSCIHDDNNGQTDQRLKIILKKDDVSNTYFEMKTPVSPGLRFRNYAGGGASLKVHNALKVLIYASVKHDILFLPGLEREAPKKSTLRRILRDILDGVIVLPSEIFEKKKLHYFFEITPHLQVAIAVDGDTHIIAEPQERSEKLLSEESTLWNPTSFSFSLKTNCSRALHNALILLTIAIKQSGE